MIGTEEEKSLGKNLIKRLHSSEQIYTEKELARNDIKSLKSHTRGYDKILTSYVFHIEQSLKQKRGMKIVFFVISMIIMLSCVGGVIVCICFIVHDTQSETFNISDYIIPAITAMTSFLTVYIIIPKIIAKYLFNSKEEHIMKDIVSNIQDYDKYIRNTLHEENHNNDNNDKNTK